MASHPGDDLAPVSRQICGPILLILFTIISEDDRRLYFRWADCIFDVRTLWMSDVGDALRSGTKLPF